MHILDEDRRGVIPFDFTALIPPEGTQADAFEAMLVRSRLMEAFHSDQNVLFFAYGQTGSGKTHTMLGERGSISSDVPVDGWGMFPRLVHATLQSMEAWRAAGVACELTASAVELYCGAAFDLLARPKAVVMVDKFAKFYGQRALRITSAAQVADFITGAYTNRCTNQTKMNDSSSRGHTVLVLTLHQLTQDMQYSSTTFSLVDMAGSERVAHTGRR